MFYKIFLLSSKMASNKLAHTVVCRAHQNEQHVYSLHERSKCDSHSNIHSKQNHHVNVKSEKVFEGLNFCYLLSEKILSINLDKNFKAISLFCVPTCHGLGVFLWLLANYFKRKDLLSLKISVDGERKISKVQGKGQSMAQ